MPVPCEIMTKRIIPAVRANVTKQLYNKHNLNQEEIASKLGITQAAVSKYLSERYTKEIRNLERSKIVRKISDEIVKAISREKFNDLSLKKIICKHCVRF